MDRKNLTLTEDDLAAIGDAVVQAVFEVIKTELTKLVWDVIRKIVIAGAAALWVWGQIQHFMK